MKSFILINTVIFPFELCKTRAFAHASISSRFGGIEVQTDAYIIKQILFTLITAPWCGTLKIKRRQTPSRLRELD